MSKTQVAISIFFAILMAILAMNIHMPVPTDYSLYAEHYKNSNNEIISQNNVLIPAIQRDVRNHHLLEESLPRSLFTDSVIHDICQRIENWKQGIITETGYDISQLGRKNDKRVSKYFVQRHIADSIQQLVDRCISLLIVTDVRDADRQSVEKSIYSSAWNSVGKKQDDSTDWSQKLFYKSSAASTYTLLLLIQHNLLVTERTLLTVIYLNRLVSDHFDVIEGIAVPNQALIIENSRVNYYIFFMVLAPSRTVQSFQADQGTIQPAQMKRDGIGYAGIGHWEGKAATIGTTIVRGTGTLLRDDTTLVIPWSFSYFVAAPGVSIELDNMRYCYRGIANHVSISVPGYAKDRLSLRVPGAIVKKIQPGSYEVWTKEDDTKELTAYTDATNPKGITTPVKITKLKVKDVPAPLASVNGMNEFIDADLLKKQGTLIISPSDSDFVLKYQVVSYQFSILKNKKQFVGPFEGKDPVLNNEKEIRSAINEVERGDKIYITDIIVRAGRNNIILAPVILVAR